MSHTGKLFFDFRAPDLPAGSTHWPDDVLEKMQKAVEAEIDVRDPWRDGDNARNKWLKLFNVPGVHNSMLPYLNTKLEDLKIGAVAVDNPPEPVAYCYSGDSRICYHPHRVELNGNPWHAHADGVSELIYIVIVLSYESKCFPIPQP